MHRVEGGHPVAVGQVGHGGDQRDRAAVEDELAGGAEQRLDPVGEDDVVVVRVAGGEGLVDVLTLVGAGGEEDDGSLLTGVGLGFHHGSRP